MPTGVVGGDARRNAVAACALRNSPDPLRNSPRLCGTLSATLAADSGPDPPQLSSKEKSREGRSCLSLIFDIAKCAHMLSSILLLPVRVRYGIRPSVSVTVLLLR